jgi:hypothetical protein
LTQEKPKLTKAQENKAKDAEAVEVVAKGLKEAKLDRELEAKAKAKKESLAAGGKLLFGSGGKK